MKPGKIQPTATGYSLTLVGQEQCEEAAVLLVAASQEFRVEPLPDDQWRVFCKEAGPLRRLLNLTGLARGFAQEKEDDDSSRA